MNSSVLDARTVSIVKPLKIEQRQGVNGSFEHKEILVRIAVDRDYKITRTENGKTISEHPTDFWLAKFTGATAQAFSDYCTNVKEDGKLVSRRLLLEGNFENYNKARRVSKQVNINGQLYNIEFDVDNNTNTIFVVDSMKFLDKAPTTNATPTDSVSVTPVAQPVTVAQQVTAIPTMPMAQPVVTAPVAQPVVVTQPAEVVATPVVTPVAQPIATPVEVPAVPTVAPGFIPAGETAPF